MRKHSLIAIAIVVGACTFASAGPFRSRHETRGSSCPSGGCRPSIDAAGNQVLQCGPEGCPVPQPEIQWIPSKRVNGDGRYELIRNGVFIGFWDVAGQYYRAWKGPGSWGPETTSPAELPAELKRVKIEQEELPTGVEHSKLRGEQETECTVNGRRVYTDEALMQALEDDSQKLWLVITGDGRDKLLADMKADPKFKDLLARSRVWSVPADHYSILDRDSKKPMFPIGSPGVYLGLPDGRKLYESTGPIDLDALRKADPNNKPAPAPPNPNGPAPGPPAPAPLDPSTPKTNPMIPLCCVAGGIGALYLLRRKSE